MLRPGQKIRYRKARMQRTIKGWRPHASWVIAERYNVGDENYALKLDYVTELFKQMKR